MQIIYPDTQNICDYIINHCGKWLPEIKSCFEVMNVTGCRANESFTVSMWDMSNPLVWILSPQKDSNARSFDTIDLPYLWKQYMQETLRMQTYVNYRKVQYEMNRLVGHINLNVNGRETTVHIFRYNYCMAMKYFGYTDEQIRVSIGHQSITSTNVYIYADVFVSSMP
jgi:hypothetical protein